VRGSQRRVVPVLIALAAVLVAVIALSRSSGHEVNVTVPSAEGLIAGLDVRAAGRPVGSVERVEATSDRRARITLRIDDDRVWPLPWDTKMRLRLGGTIKFTDRYVDIQRGRAAGAGIPDGGNLPAANFAVPTEFDEVFGTFDRRTRADLTRLLADGAAAISPARAELQAGLRAAPPAVDAAAGLVDDLGYDPRPLQQLVRSGDRVVDAIERSDPGIGHVVQDAAATFAAIASQGRALQRALHATPDTLVAARTTLGHADRSLTATSDVLDVLSPGVREAQRLVRTLEGALRELRSVGPDARSTLASLRRASPGLTKLLQRATPLAPTLASAGKEAAKQLDCIRPYTPEINGLAATWGPRVWGFGDGKDKYLRAQVGSYTFTNTSVASTANVVKSTPGLRVAFPQPPGFVAGQPWFQPQCGITKDVFDPAKDPESQAKEMYPKAFYDRKYPDPETGR